MGVHNDGSKVLSAHTPKPRKGWYLDIIDERHNMTSTILSSQIPVSAWYDLIGEQTIADAVLDRIVNSSHRIILKGESLRKGKLSMNK